MALTGAALGLGMIGTGLAFVLYYIAVDGLGAVTASTATYIAPVVAMPIGIGLLDEPLHPITIPGVLLILGGAVLAQRPARNGSPPSPPSSVLTRTEGSGRCPV